MTKKISELTSAVVPLTGDEDVLLVQAGVTRRAASKLLAQVLFAGVEDQDIGAGTTDDLALDDIEAHRRVRLTATADTAVLNGIDPGTDPDARTIMLTNVSNFMITLGDEAGSSTAAFRFAINGDSFLMPGCSAWFIYDESILRWSKVGI